MDVESDVDALRIALLYLVMHILLSNTKKAKVSSIYVQLVEDLEAFDAFPWGTVIFEEMKTSIKRAVESMVARQQNGIDDHY